MIKYLEQLAELYWYKFSGLIVFLVIFALVALVLLARSFLGTLEPSSQHK